MIEWSIHPHCQSHGLWEDQLPSVDRSVAQRGQKQQVSTTPHSPFPSLAHPALSSGLLSGSCRDFSLKYQYWYPMKDLGELAWLMFSFLL